MVLLQTSHRGALRAWCQEVGWKRSLLLEQDVPSVQLRQLRKRRVLSYSIPQITFFFFFLLRTRRVMGIAKEGGSESRAGQSRAVTWRGWPPEGSSAVRRASQVNRVSRSRRTSMIFFGESHSQSDLHDSQQLESPPNEFTSKNRQTRKGNSCTNESVVT